MIFHDSLTIQTINVLFVSAIQTNKISLLADLVSCSLRIIWKNSCDKWLGILIGAYYESLHTII